jgi:hypothetical protein
MLNRVLRSQLIRSVARNSAKFIEHARQLPKRGSNASSAFTPAVVLNRIVDAQGCGDA